MKKKIIGMVCLICVLTGMVSVPSIRAQEVSDEPENLYAQCAVLMDADSGRILFGKEEHKVRPMASTTKIMTCILTLEQMEEGQVVSVSDYAASQPKVRLGVRGREEYNLRDLLYSLMLESHNDSAVVIAEGIAGSVEEFAALMNRKAEALGCMDTHFVTPNGLDAFDEKGTHATTAADLARIMKYCITESPKKEQFLEITRTKSYAFTNKKGDRSFSCNNHNVFLDMMEGALTGKTGFTADAGYCYVGALRRGKRTFIVALLACGWPNNKGYKWSDTRKLMEYGLENYEYRDVWEPFDTVEIPVKKGACAGDIYVKDTVVEAGLKDTGQSLELLLRKDEQTERKVVVSERLTAPVKKGTRLGKVTYLLEGKVIESYEIVAFGNICERTFGWCFEKVLRHLCV